MKKYLVLLVATLFLFIGCETDTPVEFATSDNFQMEFESSQPMSPIPANVEWHWRRIQVEGDQSCYGNNSVNGDDNNAGSEADFNFDNITSNQFNKWSGDATPVSNGHIGTYSAYFTGSTNQNIGMTGKVDIGETINETDSVIISFWTDDVTNVWEQSVYVGFYKKNQFYDSYKSQAWYMVGNSSVWRQYSFSKYGFNDDIGFILIQNGAQHGVDFMPTTPYTMEVDFDDIRVYSSAGDLPPVARVYDVSIEFDEDINFIVEFETSDEETEDYTIQLYYEDPRNGLYYRADNDDIQPDGSGGSYEMDEDFLKWLDNYDMRMLPATIHADAGYELHINEVDEFVGYATGK